MHIGEDLTLPTKMVESVLKAMPDVDIVQLTDDATPQIKGVSSVVRKRYNGYLMTFRMEFLAELDYPWLSLDTDVLVLKDLSFIFDKDFDVALTRRYNSILDQEGNDLTVIMPYNAGVMFSKNSAFWKDAARTLQRMPESAHKWYGDQLSIRLSAEKNVWNVLELACDEYNYTPNSASERKDVYVMHFKGKRKDWMLNGNY